MSEEDLQWIVPDSCRKADGWYPVLAYPGGGRVIGDVRCATQDEASREAAEMLDCIRRHPTAFLTNHPAKGQLIDLTLRRG